MHQNQKCLEPLFFIGISIQLQFIYLYMNSTLVMKGVLNSIKTPSDLRETVTGWKMQLHAELDTSSK